MKKIVVLGGGYGGVVTSKHLAKLFKKDKDVQIQLIDRNPYHTLLTELHEVAANRAPEDSVKIELKKILPGKRWTWFSIPSTTSILAPRSCVRRKIRTATITS
ncbi:hypothetical protein HMSSN036_93000 [Paenibacillus macerans]|nr:hypothetical protein HMSSN036_93000 [Paenibacillus macerans]